jgi:hypothetical protein
VNRIKVQCRMFQDVAVVIDGNWRVVLSLSAANDRVEQSRVHDQWGSK